MTVVAGAAVLALLGRAADIVRIGLLGEAGMGANEGPCDRRPHGGSKHQLLAHGVPPSDALDH